LAQFAQEELNSRIEALQRYLASKQVDLAILSRNSDIYYYAGSMQPLYVVVPANGKPMAIAKKALTRISAEAAHLDLEPFTGGKELAAIFARRGLTDAHRVGLTLDTLSYTSATRLMRLFPQAEPEDIAWDLRMLRAAKTESEIAIQVRSGKVMAKVPEIVKSSLEPGMTELELSALLESYYRLNGNGGILRCRREGMELPGCGLCSSGTNSLVGTKFEGICSGMGLSPGAPYGASRDPIGDGVPIILDNAFNLDGYIIDQTRMACIGKPSDEVMRAYDAMVKIESALLDTMKPGAIWEDIYNLAVKMADTMGYADTFMGFGAERVRFVGHGVGIEIDEPPYLAPEMKYPLQAGMTIAVEPKVALPGIGIVGIEDTVIVRDGGVEHITTAPKEFITT
jgi:Xaa-Pro dipeptidase